MDVLNVHLPRLLDLASNFNIDLSGVLAGYAQKLRDDVPEMENFSFPEAALLLQHCAEIYGRKVDYVYNLAVELCENMNVRMYGPSGSAPEESVDTAATITKKLNSRRRKTIAHISVEDFKFQKISLDKTKTIHHHKKKKKHCREAVCVRLASVNLLNSHELHIFEDDQYASIGTKDQFRLNWPIEHNCQIEEYVYNDGGSRSVWDVMDVGVSNMPTPEYSDDGRHDVASEDTQVLDNECTYETGLFDDEPESNIPFVSSESNLQEKVTDAMEESIPESQSPSKEIDKPPENKQVMFKLPYELTKKGLRGGKPEKNITLFLFSDYLKRELKMDGLLPPMSNKKGDKNLISKHVQYIKKRYKLEEKDKGFTPVSLLENQTDFLGFEEVVLDDSPDTDTNEYDNGDNFNETGDDNGDNFNETGDVDLTNSNENDNYDNILSFQEKIQKDFNAIKKTVVDSEGVSNWRHFIQTKLAGEEQQTKFDVHEYGTNIINSFQNVGQTLPFSDIVKGMDHREISRYFVSSLMMANTSNLLLAHDGPDTLQLTLNHTERHHDMEDILVPPSVGGLSSPSRQSKRKADCESDEEGISDRRLKKQVPGSGPWKNKSKKGGGK
ncbi:condensin-2 complex subunit H2-like [Thrips palmi]|uniref:Condensin-2 complex subunit H2-like n=1 Tax=Thrips palmi TaxID=161013 RepID=A0A6P8Y6H8_THRPL|nr:condensin-2 complex subunit H2-like [Thrips palmi]XP_034235233.1 condensin-2 complex subunit H2-like [Thrips palmi]